MALACEARGMHATSTGITCAVRRGGDAHAAGNEGIAASVTESLTERFDPPSATTVSRPRPPWDARSGSSCKPQGKCRELCVLINSMSRAVHPRAHLNARQRGEALLIRVRTERVEVGAQGSGEQKGVLHRVYSAQKGDIHTLPPERGYVEILRTTPRCRRSPHRTCISSSTPPMPVPSDTRLLL